MTTFLAICLTLVTILCVVWLNVRFATFRWQNRTIVTLVLLKSDTPIDVEAIAAQCSVSRRWIGVALLELERSGLVVRTPRTADGVLGDRFAVPFGHDPGRRNALIRTLERDVHRRYL